MKLSAAQALRFLQHPDPAVRVILIYGPDAGLVSERAEALAALLVPDKNNPFTVSRLVGSDVKERGARLYDEASALSLGGGRRLVRLQQTTEACAPAVSSFLDAPPACDSVILIEAGDLDGRSKLRLLCEKHEQLAATIACYVEDSGARLRTVSERLKGASLQAAQDVLRFLVDVLPPDRLAMQQELDKLLLYMQGHSQIALEDVKAIISDAGGADIDDAVHAVASGQTRRAAMLLDRLFEEQTAPVALFRAMQRHLLRLQTARFHMAGGMSGEAALKKLSPPVFWKNLGPMTQQLSRWPLERIELRLAQLCEAEAAVKRTGTPDIALCSQLLLQIAAKG